MNLPEGWLRLREGSETHADVRTFPKGKAPFGKEDG